MRTDHLLRLHRQHIAIEHRGGLGDGFIDREHRHLDREPTGLRHAALHVVHTLGKMRMTGVQLGPCIEHADHRLAAKILLAITELHHPRPMPEAAQVVRREPAGRPQRGGIFLHHRFTR
jgi:hypothetical protein